MIIEYFCQLGGDGGVIFEISLSKKFNYTCEIKEGKYTVTQKPNEVYKEDLDKVLFPIKEDGSNVDPNRKDEDSNGEQDDKKPYLSDRIKSLNVLVGKNGSGKTHKLLSMAESLDGGISLEKDYLFLIVTRSNEEYFVNINNMSISKVKENIFEFVFNEKEKLNPISSNFNVIYYVKNLSNQFSYLEDSNNFINKSTYNVLKLAGSEILSDLEVEKELSNHFSYINIIFEKYFNKLALDYIKLAELFLIKQLSKKSWKSIFGSDDLFYFDCTIDYLKMCKYISIAGSKSKGNFINFEIARLIAIQLEWQLQNNAQEFSLNKIRVLLSIYLVIKLIEKYTRLSVDFQPLLKFMSLSQGYDHDTQTNWVGQNEVGFGPSLIEDFSIEEIDETFDSLVLTTNDKDPDKEIIYKNFFAGRFKQLRNNFIDFSSNFSHDHNLGEFKFNVYSKTTDINKLNIVKSFIDNNSELGFYDSSFLRLNFYPKLSDGQFNLINLLSSLLTSIEIFVKDDIPRTFDGNIESKTVLLLLDEPDSGFHPEWSQEFIFYLNDFLEWLGGEFNVNFQIIITTHSPFMLSDLPPWMVLVAEDKDDGSYPNFVRPTENTFGASIPSLFKNQFYLDEYFTGKLFYENFMKYYKINLSKDMEGKSDVKIFAELIADPFFRHALLTNFITLKEK